MSFACPEYGRRKRQARVRLLEHDRVGPAFADTGDVAAHQDVRNRPGLYDPIGVQFYVGVNAKF